MNGRFTPVGLFAGGGKRLWPSFFFSNLSDDIPLFLFSFRISDPHSHSEQCKHSRWYSETWENATRFPMEKNRKMGGISLAKLQHREKL
jgi:hypothetical protein